MKTIPIFLFLIILTFSVYSQNEKKKFEGVYQLELQNKKSIHHPKNENVKLKLMFLATKDAIEKGANIQMEGLISNIENEISKNSTFDTYSNFFNNVLQKYNVSWQRTSNFDFRKIDKNLIECRVEGYVINLEIENTKKTDDKIDENLQENKTNIVNTSADNSTVKQFTVVNKSLFFGNKIYVSPMVTDSKNRLIKAVVYREMKQKSYAPNVNIYKPKAYLLLDHHFENGNYSYGKIAKGNFNVRPTDIVEIQSFKLKRKGLQFSFSRIKLSSSNSLNSSSISKWIPTDDHDNISGFWKDKLSQQESSNNYLNIYSFGYFMRNYYTNFGWNFGIDRYDVGNSYFDTEKKDVAFANSYFNAFYINFEYNIPLIQHYLLITPFAHLSFFGISSEDVIIKNDLLGLTTDDYESNLNVMYGIGALVVCRISVFDFNLGVSYRKTKYFDKLETFYLTSGVSINFVKN